MTASRAPHPDAQTSFQVRNFPVPRGGTSVMRQMRSLAAHCGATGLCPAHLRPQTHHDRSRHDGTQRDRCLPAMAGRPTHQLPTLHHSGPGEKGLLKKPAFPEFVWQPPPADGHVDSVEKFLCHISKLS